MENHQLKEASDPVEGTMNHVRFGRSSIRKQGSTVGNGKHYQGDENDGDHLYTKQAASGPQVEREDLPHCRQWSNFPACGAAQDDLCSTNASAISQHRLSS